MDKIELKLSPPQNIVEVCFLELAGSLKFWEQKLKNRPICLFVSESSIFTKYINALTSQLDNCACSKIEIFKIPDGEKAKDFEPFQKAIDFLIQNLFTRDSVLIALGGGAVSDFTGFVASVYMRGIDFIFIPTTLLSQVDAAIGGKTAINHPSGKNIIGTFSQPKAILIDPTFAHSLPEREFISGIAEIIKYGIIYDERFFEWLEENADKLLAKDTKSLEHAIYISCKTKVKVVEEDECETGIRSILNYGHTFCHAIETGTQYEQYLHGEAVGIGMCMAADLSARLGRLDWKSAKRIKTLVSHFNLPTIPPSFDMDKWEKLFLRDKKNTFGSVRFILNDNKIGKVTLPETVDTDYLLQTLSMGKMLCEGS